MNNLEDINKLITKNISYITIFIYILVIFVLTFNTIYSIYIYSLEIKDTQNQFKSKMILEESVSYSLNLILVSEILKLLYIKSFKTLVFIACLIILKLVLNYYLYRIKELDYNPVILEGGRGSRPW